MEASIKIQRPSFDCLEKKYKEISEFDIKIYEKRKKDLYNELYKWAKNQGKSDELAHEFAKNESLWLVSIEFAEKQVGGKAEELFNSDQRAYVNICALRISYALNHSTHPINTMDKQVAGRGYQGKDKQTYYLGVFDIMKLLKLNWKELSWKKSTYTQIIEKIKCGCSEDFYTSMNSKKENENFFEELQSIQRKGVVAMIGTDGLRHTTLWNGNDFVDTSLGISADFLNHSAYIIRELYFWDLLQGVSVKKFILQYLVMSHTLI